MVERVVDIDEAPSSILGARTLRRVRQAHRRQAQHKPMLPQIIFENENFLAINKPAGMLVHSAHIAKRPSTSLRASISQSASNHKNAKSSNLQFAISDSQFTLVDWLLQRYPEIKNVGDHSTASEQVILRPGIVHRLDKDTSGIMLIPKTQEYFLYLKKLFQEHKIKKTYLAIVFGIPKEKSGIIKKPIGIKEGTIKRSVHSKKQAKEAITEYKVLKTFEFPHKSAIWSLLEVIPRTGRTHQIRIHLSSIGHPILGDALYGSKLSTSLSRELRINRQMLHALSMEFEIERGRKILAEAEPPSDFTTIFTATKND